MSFHVVDLSRDPRRAQFDYFRSLANPYVGVTVAVDVTQVLAWTKRTGSSFFLAVLYAAARAANAVPELRRRVRRWWNTTAVPLPTRWRCRTGVIATAGWMRFCP